jgi:AraC-like DNA-binding protein
MTRNEFVLEYELNDLFEYGQMLARVFDTPLVDNELIYPADIAKGGCKFFKVNDYISFQLIHCTALKKMTFKRLPNTQNHIAVSIMDFTFSKCTQHKYNCNEIFIDKNSLSSAQCKSTTVPETIILQPGDEIKVVFILLKENWIHNVLPNDDIKQKLIKYLKDTRANVRKEFLNPQQLKLVDEIFNHTYVRPLAQIYYESRVLNLIESLLSEVLTKKEEAIHEQGIYTNTEDIKIIQKAETFISSNIDKPFAGVDAMSKMCFMSRTKFINLFQRIYGMSSYDYYQKKRLNLAYTNLKTGKHSVANIAENIGYSSVSNFTTAFKKEFGILPKEFLSKLRETADTA